MTKAKPDLEYRHPCSNADFFGRAKRFGSWGRYIRSAHPTAKNLEISFASVLQEALQHHPLIDMSRDVLGGTPRIAGTRISVSMVLDAIEFYGDLEGARKSYPDLTADQVEQAVSFSAHLLECRVLEPSPTAR